LTNEPQQLRVAVLECAAKAHGLPKLSGNRSDSGATTAAICLQEQFINAILNTGQCLFFIRHSWWLPIPQMASSEIYSI
jgi:hypothetical protein